MNTYILPIFIFIITSIIIHIFFNKNPEKNNKYEIFKKTIPGIILGLIYFIFNKYKNGYKIREEMMYGNYFDP